MIRAKNRVDLILILGRLAPVLLADSASADFSSLTDEQLRVSAEGALESLGEIRDKIKGCIENGEDA